VTYACYFNKLIILPCIKCNISLVLFSPGSVATDVGWGGNLKSHLMASCVRNICAKYRQNPLIRLKVTIDNVGVPFLRHTQCMFLYLEFYRQHSTCVTCTSWSHHTLTAEITANEFCPEASQRPCGTTDACKLSSASLSCAPAPPQSPSSYTSSSDNNVKHFDTKITSDNLRDKFHEKHSKWTRLGIQSVLRFLLQSLSTESYLPTGHKKIYGTSPSHGPSLTHPRQFWRLRLPDVLHRPLCDHSNKSTFALFYAWFVIANHHNEWSRYRLDPSRSVSR